MNIKVFLFITVLFLVCFSPSWSLEPDGFVDDLIRQMQETFDNQDLQSYLNYFHPDLRQDEESRIQSMFEDFGMETVTLHKAFLDPVDANRIRLFLRVLYENPFSVIIELWRLNLILRDGAWQIDNKDVAEDIQSMYKIAIPSDRIVRANRVEINHTDIQLVFQNATVFYDNLPNRETALLVIGEGDLRFEPSLPREQHQLELLYNSPVLTDRLKYVYIRCSNYFFIRNIKISKAAGEMAPVLQSERNKAYSLFIKHYSRSFTIENSLNGQLLSFLPQGDEAVIEFEGHKIGINTYIYSPFAEEEINFYQWKDERLINLYSPQTYDDKKAAVYLHWTKIRHHRLSSRDQFPSR